MSWSVIVQAEELRRKCSKMRHLSGGYRRDQRSPLAGAGEVLEDHNDNPPSSGAKEVEKSLVSRSAHRSQRKGEGVELVVRRTVVKPQQAADKRRHKIVSCRIDH